MAIRAAGILIVASDGKALFLKRGPGGDYPGMWSFPGGRAEPGESARAAALRETEEEAGYRADSEALLPWTRTVAPSDANGEQVDFTSFLAKGVEPFVPRLGPAGRPEHTAYAWAPLDQPPEPLHPGVRIALERAGMDELAVARAMTAGQLVSPQRYGKLWLFDIRITGTGASYRPSLKEYVWRDKSLYLTDDFLARCNGLPVVWIHPTTKTQLDGEEFDERAIGTVFVPYIKGDDVWAIAKIYDEEAAERMESEPLSTSPGVVFSAASANHELKLKDGSTLLIEGKPALLDHIAVVSAGVWDKGGEPNGISSVDARADSVDQEARDRVMLALGELRGSCERLGQRIEKLESTKALRA